MKSAFLPNHKINLLSLVQVSSNKDMHSFSCISTGKGNQWIPWTVLETPLAVVSGLHMLSFNAIAYI